MGGVVARIHLLMAFGLILPNVALIVSQIVLPSCIPSYGTVSWVAKPMSLNPFIISSDVLMQRAVDLDTLI